MGKQNKSIDKRKFQKLVEMGLLRQDIADFFDVSVDELEEFCRTNYYDSFYGLIYQILSLYPKYKLKDKPYVVYMHIAPSGKKYIGVTKTSLAARWHKGEGYKGNPYFYNAIKLYGWDNIEHCVLFAGLSKEDAENKEQEMIRRFKSNDRRYGYNIEGGGSLGKEVTQETRDKISKSRLGTKASPELRKKLSDEHKDKLREPHMKPILKYDKDGNFIKRYSSMKEAGKEHGVKRQSLHACCTGKSKTSAGFVWRYAEEGDCE